jgi:hypothetical protein
MIIVTKKAESSHGQRINQLFFKNRDWHSPSGEIARLLIITPELALDSLM